MTPKISLVTPSYNQGQYIEETFQSVVGQGYPNLEHIVMDGGSTDGSVAIIERYAEHFAYWVSAKDEGQSDAINRGFARATGEIFGWINSDDVLADGALHLVAEKLGGKRMALLVGHSVLTETPHNLEGHTDQRMPDYDELLYEGRTFPQPSTFFTRDLWEAAGPLDEAMYFAMDYDLWVKMLPLAETVIEVDEVLSYARRHEETKGMVARQEGNLDQLTYQRAFASYRAAVRRGESIFAWFGRIYGRRIRRNMRLGYKNIFTPSTHVRSAWRVIQDYGWWPDRQAEITL